MKWRLDYPRKQLEKSLDCLMLGVLVTMCLKWESSFRHQINGGSMAPPERPWTDHLNKLMGEVFISSHVIPQTVLCQTMNIQGQQLKADRVLHGWVSFLKGVATAPQPYSVHIPGRLNLVESNLIFAQWYLCSWQSASWQWESSRTNPKKQLGSDRALKCHLCAHLKKDSQRGPFNGGGHQHYPQLQPVIPEVSLKTPCKTDSWTEKMANQLLGGNIW